MKEQIVLLESVQKQLNKLRSQKEELLAKQKVKLDKIEAARVVLRAERKNLLETICR